MKVLNLRCGQRHEFEGWFGSEEEFRSQLGRGLVACPFCGDTAVSKLPSAPRLNLGASGPAPATQAAPKPEGEAERPVTPPGPQALQRLWLETVARVMRSTEDVGTRFAEEARRIHYGEAPERGIRGQASPEEARALADEGIEVATLSVPEALKGPVQ